MKISCASFAGCFVFPFCLLIIAPASAQEKSTRIVIRSDTLRSDTLRRVADSLARLWIAPFIDSNKVSKNWSSLTKGLSQQAVRNLLGRPTSVKHDGENGFSYWWYGREAVVFNSVTRKVSFWDK
jgi:hypothetical protein